jgi:hypothetical protein
MPETRLHRRRFTASSEFLDTLRNLGKLLGLLNEVSQVVIALVCGLWALIKQ